MSDDLNPPERDLLSGVRTGDWLDAQHFPPVRWAVPGLIPEGFGLFTGPPKVGKSWAALGIALAVASGDLALGAIETGPARPVLLLALEDGGRRLQGRCRHLLGDEPIPELLHFATEVPAGDVLPLIRQWLNRYGDQNPVVILDTLGKVMPPALPGEGAYSRDYRIGSALKALTDAHPGSCLAVVHHIRKATSDDWMDSTSGTNGLNGAADWTLNLSRTRNEDNGLLRVTGRDVVEAEYAVTTTEGRWNLDGDDLHKAAHQAATARSTDSVGDRMADLVRFVATSPEPVKVAQVTDGLGISDATARTYLARAVDSGRLVRTGRGLYGTPVTSVTSVTFESNDTPNDTHITLATPVLDMPSDGCRIHGTTYQPDACWTCAELNRGAA